MTEDDTKFSVIALTESARTRPTNSDFMSEYIAHVRQVMARTQAEINKAMAEHPALQNLRF